MTTMYTTESGDHPLNLGLPFVDCRGTSLTLEFCDTAEFCDAASLLTGLRGMDARAMIRHGR